MNNYSIWKSIKVLAWTAFYSFFPQRCCWGCNVSFDTLSICPSKYLPHKLKTHNLHFRCPPIFGLAPKPVIFDKTCCFQSPKLDGCCQFPFFVVYNRAITIPSSYMLCMISLWTTHMLDFPATIAEIVGQYSIWTEKKKKKTNDNNNNFRPPPF